MTAAAVALLTWLGLGVVFIGMAVMLRPRYRQDAKTHDAEHGHLAEIIPLHPHKDPLTAIAEAVGVLNPTTTNRGGTQ